VFLFEYDDMHERETCLAFLWKQEGQGWVYYRVIALEWDQNSRQCMNFLIGGINQIRILSWWDSQMD